MLMQRVITAVVLLALLLPALFAPVAWPWMALTLVFIAAGAWEWGRLQGMNFGASVVGSLLVLGLCADAYLSGWVQQPTPWLWQGVGVLWVLLAVWMLRRGVLGWAQWPLAARWPLGLLLIAAAWLALSQARVLGVNFLLSSMALVWVADIAAYFFGRALGGRIIRRKLAATISPGKSWEGALGGFLGVCVLAWGWQRLESTLAVDGPSLYTLLFQRGAAWAVLALVFLTAMSVVGDLVESLVKRSAGMKDSSQLLPGHGGVLDRVDALLPTLPLSMMLVTLGGA
ncbi:phosphatidate cytidylyltransferase [Limnohabitans sp.]|uniref:phosphatidate cytidylyltransferase n=1 Tax=Limnohabitans sp. TaxID=1907725 RepID=UPI00311EBCA9